MSRMKEAKTDSRESSFNDEEQNILDDAFKSFIDDMKPFVLSLPEKQDRQRIALWIKKLCGKVDKKLSERKNRNLYAQILFQMLRRGSIEDPFDEAPKPGPLLTLPAYMSRYLDKPLVLGKAAAKENQKHPDWIREELPSSDSAFSEMVAKQKLDSSSEWEPANSVLFVRSSPIRKNQGSEKYQSPEDPFLLEDKVPKKSYPKAQFQNTSVANDSLDYTVNEQHAGHNAERTSKWTPPPSPVRRRLESRFPSRKHQKKTEDSSTRKTKSSSPLYSEGGYLSAEEKENQNFKEIELQAKTKMLEARFAEERLFLQQELDQTVRKVLDRKNSELEEVKSHYRKKQAEYEEKINRQDKKIAKLTRELNKVVSRNDKELSELQAIIQQNHINAEHELERKVHDKVAEFEQEKFLMQKEHTQNIQELLDETTERLKNIEREYMQRIDSSADKVKELESEIYQTKRSRDLSKKEIEDLTDEKEQLKERLASISNDNENLSAKVKNMEKENSNLVEDYDQALRELRRKTDSTMERMKKENSDAAHKASEVISDLEAKMNQYKQALQDSELQRKRELREMESTQRQELIRLEVNNDKTVRNLKSDLEKVDIEMQNKQKLADQSLREKSAKIKQLEDQLKEQERQAQIAIEDFKMQAEENSRKMFQEMKQQIEKVETDLKTSNHEREMHNMKFKTEMELLITNYDKQITDLKNGHEEERLRLMRESDAELTSRLKDHDKEQELLKSSYHQLIKEADEKHKAQRDIDSKKAQELEQTIRDLRDEVNNMFDKDVIQANSLRKQQLVELGMLRDEEKQNYQRQEESLTAKFRSQIEQQRLVLQKDHSSEMERMLETTNAKLKEIEREYSLSSDKSQTIITQLQSQVAELTDRVSREQSTSQKKVLDLLDKYEIEKKDLKKHHNNAIKSLNQDIEMHRTKSRQFEKKFHEVQLRSEESISHLKLEYEERIKGLLPNSARNELEETIQALREQISVIQSRAMILQEELDNRDELRFSFEANQPEFTSSRQ